jgi:hypothetical protein
MLALFTDTSLGIFNIETNQILRRLENMDFLKTFIDDACSLLFGVDPRERGLDV